MNCCPRATCTIFILNSLSLDDMGKRVDDLEKNISELMQQVETREEASSKK